MKARYLDAFAYVEGRRMNLPVKDVNAAAPFYKNIMGFTEVSRTNTPVPTIVFEKDNIQMAIAENGGDPTQEGCVFEVDNVEEALKELQANGLNKDNSAIGTETHGPIKWKCFYVVAPDGLCYFIGEKE